MSARHRLPWWLHHWAFDIGCDSAGGVGSQEGHNLQVHSLDIRTKNRHVTQDDVGRHIEGNLQATLLKPVCNAKCCHLHREYCNTRSPCWELVYTWVAGVPAGVPCSAHLSLYAAAHQATSEDYCGSWAESAGGWPLRHHALWVSGGASMIDCQLSYKQATPSCQQQNVRDVFCRTWESRELVYPPLWALTKRRLARHHAWESILTCISHHQCGVCILV